MRKWYKKFGFILMFTIIAVASMPKITYANPTSLQSNVNIPSEWAKVEIEEAKELNLLTKKIQGEYKSNITREEFSELAVKLYEALSGKEGTLQNENPFTDTQNSKVIIANDLGIVSGIGNGKFAPDDMATREEVSVLLYRTLQAAKPEYNFSRQNEYKFSDQSIISSWAQEPVSYLYGVGVISGVGGNKLDPRGNTSREEAIALSKRIYEKFSVPNIYDGTTKDNIVISRGSTPRLGNLLRNLILEEMGKPYQWGGTGPNSYDCSGLVYSLFRKMDISLPRSSAAQGTVGTNISKSDLIYGDMVFFSQEMERT